MQRLKCPFTIAAAILLCVFVYMFTAHKDAIHQWLMPDNHSSISQQASTTSTAAKHASGQH
ncbi:hypothetical protein HR45_10435 [Shewanella mangrovi]|uniref:Uncharacterized protein n=1 Tax=Shewanella mangrovi TaxID=1515746 RepID=A0A094JDY8_9GAMM|nr:hypothetical protein [Shewanella mangrovi]KFZ37427.1 hypothetical protein HR45_10435 [Shewanella mangrovi]